MEGTAQQHPLEWLEVEMARRLASLPDPAGNPEGPA